MSPDAKTQSVEQDGRRDSLQEDCDSLILSRRDSGDDSDKQVAIRNHTGKRHWSNDVGYIVIQPPRKRQKTVISNPPFYHPCLS